ncbi:disease resistance protein L6-like [Rhodamnia argentea]|uniref:ADP-ribosyl cyclase/cyclic ADP-ribose hydrolase n=1 Tax=Rhodamnia argentea TaxID=178133 RepID=A0ABM3HBI8_9MYRT|nr:disease resistance protein L6-like [Rhodamnia argentea]
MANSEAGTSRDVERATGEEYQVFLSFRGPDTRYGFTDYLYHGLVNAGVRVFSDEDELRVGKVIGGNLLCAINNSMIYISIFSRTYAFSKWCLRELAHIIANVSKLKDRKSILPIFCDVELEDVKFKTPRYSDALLEHGNNYPDEVKAWREALAEVDEIKGGNVNHMRCLRWMILLRRPTLVLTLCPPSPWDDLNSQLQKVDNSGFRYTARWWTKEEEDAT